MSRNTLRLFVTPVAPLAVTPVAPCVTASQNGPKVPRLMQLYICGARALPFGGGEMLRLSSLPPSQKIKTREVLRLSAGPLRLRLRALGYRSEGGHHMPIPGNRSVRSGGRFTSAQKKGIAS